MPDAPTVGQQFGFHDGSAVTPSHDIMVATGSQQTFDFGGNPSAAASHEQGASLINGPAAFGFPPATFDPFIDDPAAFVFMDDPAAFVFMNDVAAMATTQERALDINDPADAAAEQQASGSQEMGIENMDGKVYHVQSSCGKRSSSLKYFCDISVRPGNVV